MARWGVGLAVAASMLLGIAAVTASTSGALAGKATAGSPVRDGSGGSITYVSDRSGEQGGVDAIDPRGTRIRQLVRNVEEATWAPDGKELAFLRGTPTAEPYSSSFGLWVVGEDGRGARRLVTDQQGSCVAPDYGALSWSPDSSTIAVLRESSCKGEPEIWSVDVASGRLRRLRQAPAPPEAFNSVSWSPSGRQIAFVETPYGRYGAGALYVMNADGTSPRLISGGDVDVDALSSPPSWAPDGERLVYAQVGQAGDASQFLRIVDLRTGDAHRLALPRGTGEPTWSPDGKWIAVTGVHGVVLVRPDGKRLRQLLPSGYAESLAWSPDSKSIAIQGQGGTSTSPGPVTDRGPVDVWVVPIDGRPARRVTQGWRYGTDAHHPQWLPTGAPLARLGGPYVSPAFASDSLKIGNLLKTTRPVGWLAADGPRVALAYDNSPHRFGNHDEVWEPRPRAVTVLGDENWCSSPSCVGIAIAGDQVAELSLQTDAPRDDLTGLLTGSLASPRMEGTGSFCSGGWECLGVPIDDLLGSGSMFAFDTWTTPCQLSQPDCTGRPKTNGRLFRLSGTQVVQIASSAGALTPLSVDAGRILVDHEDGTLDIRTGDGAVVHSFSFNAALVKTARLQGNDLVVQTPTALEVTNATTGEFERRWPLPTPDATLADLQDGTAVLVGGTNIYLERLSDGKVATIPVPGSAPVLAQFDTAGLYYSYTVNDPTYPGRVAFLPTDQLPLR